MPNASTRLRAAPRYRLPIVFDDAGRGSDVIVLIHGHPFNRTMWQPQRARLVASGWRFIAPDLRGYGASPPAAGKTTLDLFADDIADTLDRLDIERVVLAGLSMGGQIAMEFCRTRADRVRGLILAATFPQAETEAGRRSRLLMADWLLRAGMEPYAYNVITKMLAPASICRLPAVAQHVMHMMCRTDPVGAAAALRGRAERPCYESTLASLRVPSLIVAGSEDVFTTRADAERMHALLPGSELLWLDGIGHMPNLEASTAFNAAMCRLLDTVRSR